MGVKSLWNLLSPVGRPILLETVEGNTMAIDSSIWIYQFQATMRDKEGRLLVNAHVLGFLRRITKLLFYGIKPVFVFDGGAPALKRNTLAERRRKKSGAATSHTKLAERLLAARLRKEALEHVQCTTKGKEKAGGEDNIVYLEDVDPTIPKANPRQDASDSSVSTLNTNSEKKRRQFHDHDPYRLPDVDLGAVLAKATRSAAPDPRLATEDELRAFIEEMRPEDFDVSSPEFRELPTEVQYEIIGDLRLKSRQTSYARLEKMLRHSRTPMDFSKAQIQNLRQRNSLTQQLLITTDSIGKAHISIPVRIASERNKEYVLIKNEAEAGGWILGIRDHGTREKPIVIEGGYTSGDEDLEEVSISASGLGVENQRLPCRETALPDCSPSTIVLPSTSSKQSEPTPLFDLDGEDQEIEVHQAGVSDSESEDLLFAIQASIDVAQAERATKTTISREETHTTSDAIDDAFTSPSRLQTVLSFANVGQSGSKIARKDSSSFGRPSPPPPLLGAELDAASDHIDHGLEDTNLTTPPSVKEFHDAQTLNPETPHSVPSIADDQAVGLVYSSSDEEMEEVLPEAPLQAMNDIFATSNLVSAVPKTISQKPLADKVLIATDSLDTLDGGEEQVPSSRSPSPATTAMNGDLMVHVAEAETWDAAQEMDPYAEEGEFVRFVSQVKGRELEQVRREIDDEIESLNQQRKAAMRDSEDITQHMIAQIMTMLRLFGIPYITAPMEAEAQCAELVSLGLVDGVITDDSDVFLFGAQRVFKNMFNQSKTVECFLLSDLKRELGLDRDTLIRLAYLLGSDYVEGLPGIGPVVAMELLKEFPGMDGLHKFKEWWLRVQRGRDTPEDTMSGFRKRFKKKFKSLFLDKDWPDSAVRDAYYHPAVDSSEEPFKWGMPDLDGLRQFFQQELGWQQAKIDELLLPIIQKMNRRTQANAVNKQSNLTEFFDVSAGMGTYIPKKRQAYTSRRLQDVVADFRKRQKTDHSATLAEVTRGSSRRLESDDGPNERDKGAKKNMTTERRENNNARAKANKKTVKHGGSRKAVKGVNSTSEIEAEDIEDAELT